MNPNTILESIGRIYDNVEIALWSMMLSFVIYFFVFIVPKLPEIREIGLSKFWPRKLRRKTRTIAKKMWNEGEHAKI